MKPQGVQVDFEKKRQLRKLLEDVGKLLERTVWGHWLGRNLSFPHWLRLLLRVSNMCVANDTSKAVSDRRESRVWCETHSRQLVVFTRFNLHVPWNGNLTKQTLSKWYTAPLSSLVKYALLMKTSPWMCLNVTNKASIRVKTLQNGTPTG